MSGTKNVVNLEKLWGGGGVLGRFWGGFGEVFWWDDRGK